MGLPVGDINESLGLLGNDFFGGEMSIPCKYNPIGFWVRMDGKFFEDESQTKEIKMSKDESGYLYYEKDGKRYYAHRMVVFTFGDCTGREYQKFGFRSVVDHLDMKHDNNDVTNLQLVSKGINLFRAYYKTGLDGTKNRFLEYYNSLDTIDKMILDKEIEADIKGMY